MQQVLQWLCKETNEKDGQRTSHSNKKKETSWDKGTARSKKIVVSGYCGASQRSKGFEGSKFDVKKLKSFALFCRKDIAKSCFYSTINIKRPRTQGFDNMHQYWIQKIKKEDIAKGMREIGQKADSSSAHAGTKVLPINDATLVEQCSSKPDKKVMPNGESKIKAKSRMKELLRWAVASKSEKGGKFISKVSRIRNQGTLKAGLDDDRVSNDSPKISFRWEAESCSSVTSAYSSVSAASSLKNCSITLNSATIQEIDHYHPRKGSWITTDSEFVVLEL